MKTITFSISDEEYKVMEAGIIEGPEAWIGHMAKDKARKLMDRIIESETSYRAKALDPAEKEAMIRPMTLEAAKDRNAREMSEMEARIKESGDAKKA